MFDFNYTYKDFPKWKDECEGMETIQGELDNVRVHIPEQVVFAHKDGIDLHIQFVFPQTVNEDEKYPIIIHSKGSAWMKQNLAGPIGDFAPVIQQGYGLAVVEYRPAPDSHYPSHVIDFKDGIRYIVQHADEWPIDLNNVFISGDSSGGHTAVMTYLTWNEPVLDDPDKTAVLPELRGLIDFYGVTNVEKLANTETGLTKEQNAALLEALFDQPWQEYVNEANFACYIDLIEKLPPALIIHGNKDRLVPLVQSIELFTELKKRHVDTRLIMVNDADHSGAVYWGHNVLEIVAEFLKKNTR